MKYFTFCNKYHSNLNMLLKSAKRFGIDITVLGIGVSWTHNSLKLKLLFDAITDLPDDEVIVATDAFDVIYLQPEEVILKNFLNLKSPIIYASEQKFSHHFSKQKKYWESIAKSGYKYLNSGVCVGYVWAMKQMLNELFISEQHKSDQKMIGNYACTKGKELIKLDYFNNLFWCTSIVRDQYKIYEIKDGQFYIPETKGYPCFIHNTNSALFGYFLNRVIQELGINKLENPIPILFAETPTPIPEIPEVKDQKKFPTGFSIKKKVYK